MDQDKQLFIEACRALSAASRALEAATTLAHEARICGPVPCGCRRRGAVALRIDIGPVAEQK